MARGGVQLSLLLIFLSVTLPAFAVERIHFLIPGGAGGGWDTTARGIGEALARSGLIESASYENLSGGGGSRALAHLIETASRQQNSLMITSAPIILRSLRGIYPQSFRDLTPVASVVVDYGAFVVRVDSPYRSWRDVIEDFSENPRGVNVAGGSSIGSMDHVVAALAFKRSGVDAKQLKYIPYNAGGHAMVGLLSGETQLLSTGLSEALALQQQGEVRVLAMTAAERLRHAPDIPTLAEQDVPAVFENWRGFFAAPGVSSNQVEAWAQILRRLPTTREWQQIRDNRGWTDFPTHGGAFVEFLERQEREMNGLLIELGLQNVATR